VVIEPQQVNGQPGATFRDRDGKNPQQFRKVIVRNRP
jgi:hypothetical protein